jgi:hypothetical protein
MDKQPTSLYEIRFHEHSAAMSCCFGNKNVTVHTFLERLLATLQRSVPHLKEVHVLADGAESQFKQRYLFLNLTHLAEAFNILVSWHFFASYHGKGVVDGLGATVKRLVHQQILIDKDSEVEAIQEELHDIVMNTCNLPCIQKIHSSDVMDVDTIQYGNYSTNEKEVICRF